MTDVYLFSELVDGGKKMEGKGGKMEGLVFCVVTWISNYGAMQTFLARH